MKFILQQIHYVTMLIKCKIALLTGNCKAEQIAIEQIVLLHTQMQVEKNQVANALLFTHKL